MSETKQVTTPPHSAPAVRVLTPLAGLGDTDDLVAGDEVGLSPEIEAEVARRVQHEVERRIAQIQKQLDDKFEEAVQRRVEERLAARRT